MKKRGNWVGRQVAISAHIGRKGGGAELTIGKKKLDNLINKQCGMKEGIAILFIS
jgi:hypothetical protein